MIQTLPQPLWLALSCCSACLRRDGAALIAGIYFAAFGVACVHGYVPSRVRAYLAVLHASGIIFVSNCLVSSLHPFILFVGGCLAFIVLFLHPQFTRAALPIFCLLRIIFTTTAAQAADLCWQLAEGVLAELRLAPFGGAYEAPAVSSSPVVMMSGTARAMVRSAFHFLFRYIPYP